MKVQIASEIMMARPTLRVGSFTSSPLFVMVVNPL